jgi:hypothetical protein
MKKHRDDIGVKATLDIDKEFLKASKVPKAK